MVVRSNSIGTSPYSHRKRAIADYVLWTICLQRLAVSNVRFLNCVHSQLLAFFAERINTPRYRAIRVYLACSRSGAEIASPILLFT